MSSGFLDKYADWISSWRKCFFFSNPGDTLKFSTLEVTSRILLEPTFRPPLSLFPRGFSSQLEDSFSFLFDSFVCTLGLCDIASKKFKLVQN